MKTSKHENALGDSVENDPAKACLLTKINLKVHSNQTSLNGIYYILHPAFRAFNDQVFLRHGTIKVAGQEPGIVHAMSEADGAASEGASAGVVPAAAVSVEGAG